jgi:tetratricopeptide (TPR) repeat protein
LRHLGLAAYDQGAYGEARQLLGESLALSRAMGSPWSIAYSLNVLGTAACAQGAEAQQLLHEALALSQALADRYNTASAKSGLGMVHQALGNEREARCCFEESLAIWREIGEQGGLAQTLNRYGQSLSAQADGQMARRCFLEALAVARNAEITPIVLDALLGVAVVQAQEGNLEAALEMVVHVLQDPAHTQGVHSQAERLRANLESDLTAEQIDCIRARAQDKTQDALVRELLDAL